MITSVKSAKFIKYKVHKTLQSSDCNKVQSTLTDLLSTFVCLPKSWRRQDFRLSAVTLVKAELSTARQAGAL